MSLDQTIRIPSHCVVVPFLNRIDQVVSCMNALLKQGKPNTVFLMVDDGSDAGSFEGNDIKEVLEHHNVYLIHHKKNHGVSAARNTALAWCRKQGFELVIMMDSDCEPDTNVINEHLSLHTEHPEAACIGATITGRGEGMWARLDGLTSWVHASSHSDANEFRAVEHPYHLATTNFSAKLDQLPKREFVFDERLGTGEDCMLVRELRRENKAVYFSAKPRVFHNDREKFFDVLKHHYRWGHHQYFIQLGGDISPRCFMPLYRVLFFLAFLAALPLFALAGSILNAKPLWVNRKKELMFYPLMLMLWIAKGIAVLEAAVRPEHCLMKARVKIEYQEEQLDNGYDDI